MNRPRYLETTIRSDLEAKMVLVDGPRQVGKTTMARKILAERGDGAYFNWDNAQDRREIKAARWPGGRALVVLDEIHKWARWKGWLKGEFDKHRDKLRFLVTGSARLDLYRRGGDSLQGRYHHYRLHPFSCAEGMDVRHAPPAPGAELSLGRGGAGSLKPLMEYGGFPEPFIAQSARTLRRWQKERLERFFREDVRDLEIIREMSSLQLMADLFPERVGSPLSLNSLREDLEVSHRAVSHWLDVFERLYHVFVVRPYATRRVRALKKMPKVYLWDWSLVPATGPRFENLIASHLLKLCHYLEDTEGHKCDLHYVRDRAGREVDFLVTADRKPWFAVEAKIGQQDPDPSIVHLGSRLEIPWLYQISLEGERDFIQDGVRCLPAERFLSALV